MADGAESSDAILMQRMAHGDREAFASLIRLYQEPVLAIAYRFLGNRSDAEEAAQEVFLRLWRAAARYRPQAPLAAYLRRLTVNYCLDLKRKPAFLPLSGENEPPGAQDPHGELEALERGRALERAVLSLSASQKMAVVLFHMEGLSVKDVASLLETSPKAVESLLSRARALLRERLEGLFRSSPSGGSEECECEE